MQHKRILVFCAVLAGLVWGLVRPALLAEADLAGLVDNLHVFATNFDPAFIGFGAIGASLFRHGHILLLIWICAILPKILWATFPLLFLRAMTLGFSISLMIWAFGLRGLPMSLALNIPQNLLTIAAGVYTVCLIEKMKKLRLILIGAASLVLAATYEVFIAPLLFSLLI